jgi:hypothetical protein
MPAPTFGALGATFTVVRGMQAVSLISIIGMTANFISEMVAAENAPPNVLVGTLSVVSRTLLCVFCQPILIPAQTCIAVLYCAISYILYYDNQLPFLVSTAIDSLLLIAVIVVAVTIGKPLSYLNCAALSNAAGNTIAFVDTLGHNMGKVDYFVWAGASGTTCYETKAIWGLSIALCILFALSSIVSACLWKRQRTTMAPKSIV